jgi:hypothetical protein
MYVSHYSHNVVLNSKKDYLSIKSRIFQRNIAARNFLKLHEVIFLTEVRAAAMMLLMPGYERVKR